MGKKLLLTVLCACIALSAAACAKGTASSSAAPSTSAVQTSSKSPASKSTENIADYAEQGKIMPQGYTLKKSLAALKKQYDYEDPDSGTSSAAPSSASSGGDASATSSSPSSEFMAGGNYTSAGGLTIFDRPKYYELDVDNANMYIAKMRPSDGVVMIGTTDNCYGFLVGVSTPDDVEATLGPAAVEKTVQKAAIFFLYGAPQSAQVYGYRFGNNEVDFYFVGGLLLATVLWDTAHPVTSLS